MKSTNLYPEQRKGAQSEKHKYFRENSLPSQLMRWLYKWGISPHATNAGGASSFHAAASKHCVKTLRMLRDWGADVHACIINGANAAHLASAAGAVSVLYELNDWMVDLDAERNDGASTINAENKTAGVCFFCTIIQ